MRIIPKDKVIQRIIYENPWWQPPNRIYEDYFRMSHRDYFEPFEEIARDTSVRRAVVLMGPRRVGKTVMLYQLIQKLISDGVSPKKLCYISVDHPIYNGLGLEDLFSHCREAAETDDPNGFYVFFDEIQYLRDWEVHLKVLVDSYRKSRFIVSGSAAAALRIKSNESGAGRFTDFLLPPLTFHEYLSLVGKSGLISDDDQDESDPHDAFNTLERCSDLDELNRVFITYLNYGGYPEVAVSSTIQSDPGRYIKNDIVDKVLLRDLPILYGIQDIQELNSLFTTLAFNTANEVSLNELSKNSGVAKNTIKRYIEYLEAAFLIKRVHRIDQSARRFQRATYFKTYLTNSSIRSALFSPVKQNDPEMGNLVETAIFSQWFHSQRAKLHYARWKNGEVDMVYLSPEQKPSWLVEAKWSDRVYSKPSTLKSLVKFSKKHKIAHRDVIVTTVKASGIKTVDGVAIEFIPASIYCYAVGRNLIRPVGSSKRSAMQAPEEITE